MWHTTNATPTRRKAMTTYVPTGTPAASVSARYRFRDDNTNNPSGFVSTQRAHSPLATLVMITRPTNATSVSGAHAGRACAGSAASIAAALGHEVQRYRPAWTRCSAVCATFSAHAGLDARRSTGDSAHLRAGREVPPAQGDRHRDRDRSRTHHLRRVGGAHPQARRRARQPRDLRRRARGHLRLEHRPPPRALLRRARAPAVSCTPSTSACFPNSSPTSSTTPTTR